MTSLRIGLTGGIGSGKSTVSRAWVGLGAALVDTDAISRSLTAPRGAAVSAVAQAFGPQVLGADGQLDRAALRQRVFSDPAERRRLEAILHPMIGEEVDRQASAALRARAALLLFDVPLLTESSRWRDRVDRIVVVDCPEPVQVERVMARSGWTAAAVQAVIAQQATRIARRSIADAVVFNGAQTSLQALERDVHELHAAWTGADRR